MKLLKKKMLLLLAMIFSILLGASSTFAEEKCKNEAKELKISYVSGGKSNAIFKDEKIVTMQHGSKTTFKLTLFEGKCAETYDNFDNVNFEVKVNNSNFEGYITTDKANKTFDLYVPFGTKGNLSLTASLKDKPDVKTGISFEVVEYSLYGNPILKAPVYLFKNTTAFETGQYTYVSYKWNKEKKNYTLKLPDNPFTVPANKEFEGWKIPDLDEYKDKILKPNDEITIPEVSGYVGVFASWKNDGKWIEKDGNIYYLKNDGTYAKSTWIDEYYVKEDGIRAKSEWIFDKFYNSWFYLKSDGKYAQNEWIGSYYLKTGGYMAKSEWIFDKFYNSWFYLKSDGKYAQNEWIGSYYLKTGGYMAKSEWIFDKSYNSWFYLKSDGKYAQNEWIGGYYLNSGGYLKTN